MRYAVRSAVIVLGALAAACGSSRDTLGPTGTATTTDALEKSGTSSLIGQTWRLTSIDGQQAVPGVLVTAVFREDDRVSGSAGCNRYFGRAAATGTQLDVGLLATTMMYCGSEGLMPQEQAYLAALQKAKTYRIAGTELRLGPSAGVVTLVFKRE